MLSCEPQKIVNLNQKKEKEKGIVWLQEGYPHHAKSHHRIQTSPKWWKRMAKIEISISSLSKYYITFSSYNVSKTRSDFKKKKKFVSLASTSGFRKNFHTILLIWRGRKPSFDGCHHHFAIASLQGLTLSMILRNIQKVMKAYTSQQFFLSIMIEHLLWWNMFHGNTITPHYCKSSSHLWLELTPNFWCYGLVPAQNHQRLLVYTTIYRTHWICFSGHNTTIPIPFPFWFILRERKK